MSARGLSGFGLASLSVAALVAPSGADAATIRHDVADSSYTGHGDQLKYNAVGFLSVNHGGGSFSLGSAVLLTPEWVLTAAHVVTQNTPQPGSPTYSTSQVTFGQGSQIPESFTGSIGVSQIVVGTGWDYVTSAGNDIALVKLSTPVTGLNYPQLFTTSLGSEKTLTGNPVGYGTTGTGLTGGTTFDRNRRGSTNVIDNFGGEITNVGLNLTAYNSRIFFTDFDHPTTTSESSMGANTASSLEGLTDSGDSGGGVFVDIGGITYVVGVTSFKAAFDGNANADYGDVAGYTRVSQWNAFITTTIPEPSVAGAFALAGLFLTRRRHA